MNKLFALIACLILLTGCASTEPLDANQKLKIEAEVKAAFESLYKAAQNLDADAYFNHFDREKFTGLNADGTVWQSIAPLEKIIRPGYKWVTRVDSLTFSNVKITVLDAQTAILVNEYEMQMTLKKGNTMTDAGGGSQVWSKRSGRWLLVSVSASAKPVKH